MGIVYSAFALVRMCSGDVLVDLGMVGGGGIGLCDTVLILYITGLSGVGLGDVVPMTVAGRVSGLAYVAHGFLLRRLRGRIFMFPRGFFVVGYPSLFACSKNMISAGHVPKCGCCKVVAKLP